MWSTIQKKDFIEELQKFYAIIAMQILFNLFTVLVLTSIHALPLFEVATGLGVASIGQVFETLPLPRTVTYWKHWEHAMNVLTFIA